ncbi:NAD-dependent epimerase/dehydratase family protein [Nocardia sp. NBC_00881]|uniref:NAD-dependent epimerase/dehydratase family protein n=1 Tax=Nocardia sp. NBC_00881 TaxID=2975995 RepID=UPI00386DBDEF|nr:NAD-dependent epimerase/dehydratase family protein [Nocardia sp. NBC_00881]
MSIHVVIGAGPVGSATALLLAGRGDEVRLITRRGTGPRHPRIERIAADATDSSSLSTHSAGATAMYQCAQPEYHRWPTDFPPLIQSAISAAETTGAVLVTVGNLYGYGAVDTPITEQHPLHPNSTKGRTRAGLWNAALTAHRAGRIRTAEVRGSDYLGAGANSAFTVMVLPAVRAGKQGLFPCDPDAPHSWTVIDDMARTLVAVADDETAWGRAWHTPTAAPLSVRALAQLVADLAGAPLARVRRMPAAVLWAAGLFDSNAREMREVRYQFDRPLVLDSSTATTTFGIEPTATAVAVQATLDNLSTAERDAAGRS